MVTEAMIDSRLLNLLKENRSDPIAADCLERMSQGGEVRYQGGTSVPVNQIVDIYSVRARINSELNDGAVAGFENLLPALGAVAAPSVKLHSLEFLSHWYVLFTDESVSCLIGVLKSPKRKAVWFDPAKGYDEVDG